MKLSYKTLILLSAILLAIILSTCYLLWADKALTSREFEIASAKIPADFNGYRIVQVSDLHNAEFGKDNSRLIDRIKTADPDIIVVTGDVIDSRRTNIETAVSFLEKAVTVSPVYYITGNHEARIDSFAQLEKCIKQCGVTILDNSSITLVKGTGEINLCGISDPVFKADLLFDDGEAVAARNLDGLYEKDRFNILLAHKPDYLELYAEENFDLVFSGHAHGGQVRLPVIGGLYAPGQGILPEYDSGLYEKDGTTMIVSRGLGNSLFPLRVFNRPEIITVILKSV